MIAEGLLNQFGYSVTPSSLEQTRRIIDNTRGFNHVEKHLVVLNDKLKNYLGFVGLSGSEDYFKIKNTSPNEDVRQMVEKTIHNWSNKYKIEVQKVPNKETYYVLGYNG